MLLYRRLSSGMSFKIYFLLIFCNNKLYFTFKFRKFFDIKVNLFIFPLMCFVEAELLVLFRLFLTENTLLLDVNVCALIFPISELETESARILHNANMDKRTIPIVFDSDGVMKMKTLNMDSRSYKPFLYASTNASNANDCIAVTAGRGNPVGT